MGHPLGHEHALELLLGPAEGGHDDHPVEVTSRSGSLTLLPRAPSRSIDGLTFWMSAGEPDRVPRPRGVHLLHAYDELVVGYQRSRFFGDPRGPRALAAWKDRTLPNGVITLNGQVAGMWRRTIEPRAARIEVYPYEGLEAAVLRGLDAAASRLGRFVGRPAAIQLAGLLH